VIENTLKSLAEQTFRDFSILIIDNASTDKTLAWLAEYYPQLKVVKNRRNLGFCKGHNQAIHFSSSEYVLVMNDDIILTPGYLERVVACLEENPRVAAVQGKLYKLVGDPQELTSEAFTKIIDSTGLGAYRSRRFVERGAGAEDQGQYDTAREVFGASGALSMYRREALEDVKLPPLNPPLGKGGSGEYFDEDFGSYKEDVDLAWRLQLYGWQTVFEPRAVAYHLRTAAIKDKLWDKGLAISVMRNRRQKPAYVHIPSYRNHLCLLIKNEHNFKRDWPHILWYEFRKLVHSVLFEQNTLKGLWQFWKLLPKMRAKRKLIQEKSKVGPDAMRRWFR